MDFFRLAMLVSSLLAVAAWSQAGVPESMRAQAESQFHALQAAPVVDRTLAVPAVPSAVATAPEATSEDAPLPELKEPVFLRPELFPAAPKDMGPQVGSFVLSERLDVQRSMMTRQLGARTWDIGIAGDPSFKILFFTFRQGDRLLISRINNIQDLRGKGVDVSLDASTAYNFKVTINIFSPVRGSTLHITPINGTSGPSHKMSTGDLLDAWKAKSYVFNAGGEEYWALYGTDIDPNTNQLAGTRSFAFFHEAGMSSKFWSLGESALTTGQPYSLALGDAKVYLSKSADGRLQIFDDAGSQKR